MCAPTGVGFLWARRELLEAMPPWQGGGEMIDTVTLDGATYAPPPGRFEAGTPAIAQAVGLGAACEYLMALAPDGAGMAAVAAHEAALGAYLWRRMDALSRERAGPDGAGALELYGPAPGADGGGAGARTGLVAFNARGVHTHNKRGIERTAPHPISSSPIKSDTSHQVTRRRATRDAARAAFW